MLVCSRTDLLAFIDLITHGIHFAESKNTASAIMTILHVVRNGLVTSDWKEVFIIFTLFVETWKCLQKNSSFSSQALDSLDEKQRSVITIKNNNSTIVEASLINTDHEQVLSHSSVAVL